jgi:AraC family transcriptional regulator, ethanolamine operon transcriptional activator
MQKTRNCLCKMGLVRVRADMPNSSSIGFDAYVDNVRDAQTLFLKTGPSLSDWKVEGYLLGRLSLQFGSDGGARIVHGVMRSDAVGFILQAVEKAESVLFDGQWCAWNSLMMLSPGNHFTFAAQLPTQWISFALSKALLDEPQWSKALSVLPRKGNATFSLTEELWRELVGTANSARTKILENKQLAVKNLLLMTLCNIMTNRACKRREVDTRHLALVEHISKVLQHVRLRPSQKIKVSELAEVARLDRRSLQRIFVRYLSMGPKDYLRYRQLNLVRKALRGTDSSSDTVKQTLASYGVTELGRFSASYKRLFGELFRWLRV